MLAAAFTGLLAFSIRRQWLASVHGVQPSTVGALVFPAGLLLGAWIA